MKKAEMEESRHIFLPKRNGGAKEKEFK